jgi:hypothetical protein
MHSAATIFLFNTKDVAVRVFVGCPPRVVVVVIEAGTMNVDPKKSDSRERQLVYVLERN